MADRVDELADVFPAAMEQAVMLCPDCDGEGSYADGLDEDAVSVPCASCDGNCWIVDCAALPPEDAQALRDRVRVLEVLIPEIARLAKECADDLEIFEMKIVNVISPTTLEPAPKKLVYRNVYANVNSRGDVTLYSGSQSHPSQVEARVAAENELAMGRSSVLVGTLVIEE